jgi:hypothetical protein
MGDAVTFDGVGEGLSDGFSAHCRAWDHASPALAVEVAPKMRILESRHLFLMFSAPCYD